MKTCAVIPFYNESKFLPTILVEVKKYVDHIIAVDDGSTDNSSLLIQDANYITLLKHTSNLGKGAALRSGLSKAAELNFDSIITIDSDLQHEPSCIPSFVEEIKNFDIIIGNRLCDLKDMPFMRILSNKITSKLLSIKTGQKILDSQNGFRAFRKETIKNILPKNNGFEAESEILIRAAKNNYKIGHVKIPTIYGEEKSKMKNIEAIIGFLKVLIKKYY